MARILLLCIDQIISNYFDIFGMVAIPFPWNGDCNNSVFCLKLCYLDLTIKGWRPQQILPNCHNNSETFVLTHVKMARQYLLALVFVQDYKIKTRWDIHLHNQAWSWTHRFTWHWTPFAPDYQCGWKYWGQKRCLLTRGDQIQNKKTITENRLGTLEVLFTNLQPSVRYIYDLP